MSIKPNKFRSPSTNARYTAQLFWDIMKEKTIAERVIDPMFSLHDDVEGLINFRKEYIRDMDPTGYKTSSRLLENYDHFQLLMKNCKWFREAKKEWDKELAAKMEQEASDVLRGIMNGGEDVPLAQKIASAKVLLGKSKTIGKKEKEVPQRGRPSKEEVEGRLKQEARLSKEEAEDLERIRLVTNTPIEKKKSNGS